MKRLIIVIGVVFVTLLLFVGCGQVDEYATFRLKIPEVEFSVEYPQEGWSIEIITFEVEDIRIRFNGQLGNDVENKVELLVGCDFQLTYEEWFNIFNSLKTISTLESENVPELIDDISCYVFIQVVDGKNTRSYICDKQSYTMMVHRSFIVGTLTQQEINKLDEYALHMISTMALGGKG